MTMHRIRVPQSSDRTYELVAAADVNEARDDLATVEGPFGLFLAVESTEGNQEDLRNLATEVASRVIYVCVWGPGCSLTHDLFDLVLVESGISDRYTVMTTWHPDESLPEALRFFARAAFPADDAPLTKHWIAAV